MNGLKPLFSDEFHAEGLLVLAGPCSAESREQTLETAEKLCADGIRCFRAGIWKPRTKPGSFEGVGARGLPWLAEVRTRTGMIPLTEIATPTHLKSTLHYGINAFWIGARTVANPFAIQEIADALKQFSLAERDRITILIKNPVSPDLDLWIGAFERIYAAGIRRLGAVHRGFSAYGEKIFRNRPEWRIPLELRRRFPLLPLVCDPSHIGGRRDLILPVSQHAIDLDFDGLIVESHCDPDHALSDSSQQITPEKLREVISSLRPRNGRNAAEGLGVFREEIDRIDEEIISLLARRMDVSREIGLYKQREGLPVWQSDRYSELMSRRVAEAERLGLDPAFMRRILSTIHEESVNCQMPGIDGTVGAETAKQTY